MSLCDPEKEGDNLLPCPGDWELVSTKTALVGPGFSGRCLPLSELEAKETQTCIEKEIRMIREARNSL